MFTYVRLLPLQPPTSAAYSHCPEQAKHFTICQHQQPVNATHTLSLPTATVPSQPIPAQHSPATQPSQPVTDCFPSTCYVPFSSVHTWKTMRWECEVTASLCYPNLPPHPQSKMLLLLESDILLRDHCVGFPMQKTVWIYYFTRRKYSQTLSHSLSHCFDHILKIKSFSENKIYGIDCS